MANGYGAEKPNVSGNAPFAVTTATKPVTFVRLHGRLIASRSNYCMRNHPRGVAEFARVWPGAIFERWLGKSIRHAYQQSNPSRNFGENVREPVEEPGGTDEMTNDQAPITKEVPSSRFQRSERIPIQNPNPKSQIGTVTNAEGRRHFLKSARI